MKRDQGEWPEGDPALEKALLVKREHEERLLHIANVIGVGVGERRIQGEKTGEAALVVIVSRKVPEAVLPVHDLLPRAIDGVPVDVLEVGSLEAQDDIDS